MANNAPHHYACPLRGQARVSAHVVFMKIKKIAWWLTVALLAGASIFFLFVSNGMAKVQSEQLALLDKSIRENPTQWDRITIGKQDPMLFHKDLFISSGIAVDSAQLSAYLLLTLLAFIAGTTLYRRIKKKTQQRPEPYKK